MSTTTYLTSLKIASLITLTVCNHLSLSSPNPPPEGDERKCFDGEKEADPVPRISLWMPPVWRNMMHAFTLIEAYILLCRLYPKLIYSPIYSLLVTNTSAVTNIRPTSSFCLGFTLIFSGTVLRVLCYHLLGRNFTFELAVRKDHELYTQGPYSIVRHPAYTGAYLWVIGLQFSQFGRGSWWWECKVWMSGFGLGFGLFFVLLCLLVSGTLWTRIKKEDEVLRGVFKDQWIAWSLRTPYVILPYVY